MSPVRRSLFLGLLLALLVVGPVGSTIVRAEPASDPPAKIRAPAIDPGAAGHSIACTLPQLARPPLPPKIPGYTELDPSTGLHVTGGMQDINVEQYRLEVVGRVDRPLKLGYDELRCMPRTTARPSLVCPGFFTDVASWAGVPLRYLINQAGAKPGVSGVRLLGADNYTASLPIDVAMAEGNFLAYEWEGKALPQLHGFPLRAVLPGLEGNQWVKWIIKIEVY